MSPSAPTPSCLSHSSRASLDLSSLTESVKITKSLPLALYFEIFIIYLANFKLLTFANALLKFYLYLNLSLPLVLGYSEICFTNSTN